MRNDFRVRYRAATAAASLAVTCSLAPATGIAQEGQANVDARVPVDTAAAGALLTFEHVEGLEPWVMLSAHRVFVPRWGTTVARVTVGERFGQAGIQAEAEAYPRVGRLGYLYMAAAASPNEAVFIPFRAALELFGSPSAGLELSAGARLFQVSSRSVVAYTASIGAYRGNYWYAFRPFVVNQNGALATTGQLTLRRYWSGRYDYLGMSLSGTRGSDPTVDDPLRIGRGSGLTSFSARIERLRPARGGRLRVGGGVGVESEEVTRSNRRLHLLLMFRIERLLQ